MPLSVGLVHQDEVSGVFSPQLLVGIQQFDAIDSSIRSQVHVDFVRKLNRLDFIHLFVQPQIGNVVARIVRLIS